MAAAGIGAYTWRQSQMRYYDGPVSDHFDGTRFFDPHSSPPNSLPRLAHWMATRKRGRGRNGSRARSSIGRRGASRARLGGCRSSVTPRGCCRPPALNILIDPVWSKRVSPVSFAGPVRVNDPGIAFDALPPIDAVLVSHGHYDHLDVPTLSGLSSHRPRIVMPLGNDTIVRMRDPAIRAEVFDWGDRVVLSRDVAVTFVPIHHWSARGVTDRNKALWAAFVIETPAGRIYHVADSGYRRRPPLPRWRAGGSARSVSPSCRSAPMSRAGSCASST